MRGEHKLMPLVFVSGHLGQAEISQLGLVKLVHHDILRLDVAMRQALTLPAIVQGAGDLAGVFKRGSHLQMPFAQDAAQQGFAINIFHGKIINVAIGNAGIVGLDNVGMRHGSSGAHLVEEAQHETAVGGQLAGEHLYGHLALEINLPGQIDHSHGAAANLADNLILVVANQQGARIKITHAAL